MEIRTRPVCPDDEPFLHSLFLSWKAEELMLHMLPEDMRGPLMEIQWQAHRDGGAARFTHAERAIIVADGCPAGAWTVQRAADAHHLREIALLPQFRGQGLGRRLVAGLIEDANAAGLPLRLHVSRTNAVAFRLYQSLGFTPEDDGGAQLPMVWCPTPP
jgi:GNAT superfamily N-acetyltransferase